MPTGDAPAASRARRSPVIANHGQRYRRRHQPRGPGQIFDFYLTTKEQGTGIGLSMVYRIIQMHDGEVEVESTPGGGTTFRILLPRAHES